MDEELNFQDQNEEIESLKAIYEEEFVPQYIAESPGEESKFQVVLPVDIPEEGITLNACIQETEDKKEIIGNYNLQYLPPITLSFSLPLNYPNNQKPDFTVSAEWLTKEKLSIICKELDELNESNAGFPCIFALCNWIQVDCFSILFNDNNIHLHQLSENDQVNYPDDRAIPQCKNIQDTIMSLVAYDKHEKHIKFKQLSHTCNLCFEEKQGKEFVMLPCCENYLCSECLRHMCSTLVKNGSLNLLNCTNCSKEFTPNFLKLFLTNEEMERWDRLTFQKYLDTMSDIRYCPRCESVSIVEDNLALCPKCNYAFCGRCMGDYHYTTTCDEMAVLMKKARRSKDSENELKSLRAIQKQARKCPSCNIFISRTEGCNKMTCSQCGNYFCYTCGKQIKGYDHFNTKEGKGGCKVFDEVTDDMLFFYNHLQNLQQFEGFEAGDFNVHRLQRKNCPYCGQQNHKVGRNNDIRCQNCGNHFCFLCREKIKGTNHFTATNCVQHSDMILF